MLKNIPPTIKNPGPPLDLENLPMPMRLAVKNDIVFVSDDEQTVYRRHRVVWVRSKIETENRLDPVKVTTSIEMKRWERYIENQGLYVPMFWTNILYPDLPTEYWFAFVTDLQQELYMWDPPTLNEYKTDRLGPYGEHIVGQPTDTIKHEGYTYLIYEKQIIVEEEEKTLVMILVDDRKLESRPETDKMQNIVADFIEEGPFLFAPYQAKNQEQAAAQHTETENPDQVETQSGI